MSLEIRKRGAGCGHLCGLFVERIDLLPHQRTHARAVVALFEREQLAEGSGTSRLPADEGSRAGLHFGIGDGCNAMAHGYAWGVCTDQSVPRGGDKAYGSSPVGATLFARLSIGR